jgi:succinyl-CoA synthetase beta subunit
MIFWLNKILTSKLNISLQEYQSKKILEDNGLNIQRFFVASTPDEARDAGKKLSIIFSYLKHISTFIINRFILVNTIAKELVIKAQILAGGRGKGVFSNGYKGGVQLTKE